MNTKLTYFHPLIKQWFQQNYARPTDVQAKAWPCIADNKNVLITAPTGSGKTLTAFLWSINQLATGALPSSDTRVLYVSPLKALNNDIQRNLVTPLGQIRDLFEARSEVFPEIRALTRSGDTSQQDRRKMFRHPPQILITTPESLNLLLSSKSGRQMLHNLSTVILDEIHAVVGSKRGVHLMTAVDRLVRLSGEFQRICLSATVHDKKMVAKFMGGYRLTGSIESPKYVPRPVEMIDSAMNKKYRIQVKFPQKDEANVEDTVWDLLADEFKSVVEKNRSTLFFTNGRRLCEKMTFKLNNLSVNPVAYSHHGSLSRQLRQNVERNLKNGELKAIVATSSLEMGIDIGNLDEVVLIQSPPSISSAIQRIGRAGHKVDAQSCGTIFCAHAQDLIASAVLARAIDDQDIEPLNAIDCPLDVLSQVLISMTCLETWDMDELYAFLKTSYPYRDLSREQYDLVLNMLAGRYADTRIRELKPRLSIDRLDNTVDGKKGALLALYTSGGTIPDRGYFQLRHHETSARIGELDEEYVWEAKIGQIATVGTQNWKITKITHNDVFAVPVGNSRMDAPFWIAEGMNRDFHFSGRILHFLEQANERLKDKIPEKELLKDLVKEFHLDKTAATELIRFLKRQKEVTECDLPHRHHMVLESVRSGPDGGSPGTMLVIHTLWGGQVNRPFAMALEAAWKIRFKEEPEIFPGNDAIVIQLPHKIDPAEIFSLVPSGQVEYLIKQQLERTGFFSARFREAAGRALLVIRNKINQRMPLWMTRLKSKKLLENILKFEDFPILLETWRTCLKDEFDIDRLVIMLQQLESGAISWSQSFTARPSPFAAGMAWNQINQYMYKEDEGASSTSSLGSDLVRDLVFSPTLRPMISADLVKEFEIKCRRLAPGYAPTTARDLLDWVKERVAIPFDEWQALLGCIKTDTPEEADTILDGATPKLVMFHIRLCDQPLVVAREMARNIQQAWYGENPAVCVKDLDGLIVNLAQLDGQQSKGEKGTDDSGRDMIFLGQWLQFYGPRNLDFIVRTLGINPVRMNDMLDSLIDTRQVISGLLVKDGNDHDFCDSENFEILLRISRSKAVPQFEALDIEFLPQFLAQHQGLWDKGNSVEDLCDRIEQLACLPLPAKAWEADILPARMSPYYPSFLDTILQEGDLLWLGFDKKRIAFSFASDLDFIEKEPLSKEDQSADTGDELDTVFRGDNARYDFSQLMGLTGLDSKTVTRKLWDKVWQTDICNETFLALRKGIETKFKAPDELKTKARFGGRRRPGRGSFSRWKGSLPFAGYWFNPGIVAQPLDFLQKEELNKDRVRLLLDRYGILFRELLHKEMPPFKWPAIFRSLRLMELSGEILSGHFFKDLPGPQFISHKAFRRLTTAMPEDEIYFLNAADPASVCGLPLPGLKNKFPKRLPGNHLVFKGPTLVLVSLRNGKELQINVAPDDEHLVEYLAPLTHLLTRQFQPLKSIVIETINGQPAPQSPYGGAFETVFNVIKEYKTMVLYRQDDSFF